MSGIKPDPHSEAVRRADGPLTPYDLPLTPEVAEPASGGVGRTVVLCFTAGKGGLSPHCLAR